MWTCLPAKANITFDADGGATVTVVTDHFTNFGILLETDLNPVTLCVVTLLTRFRKTVNQASLLLIPQAQELLPLQCQCHFVRSLLES